MSKFMIPCSYGELVDKWTILKIKSSKASDEKQKSNIHRELDLLSEKIIDHKDPLIFDLLQVNIKLWGLEDKIRDLSKLKIFNDEYIKCAEDIHQFNDNRYVVKSSINDKYCSDLYEEKIYDKSKSKSLVKPEATVDDVISSALSHFPHNVKESYAILHQYVKNYKFKKDPQSVQLYINYMVSAYYIGEEGGIPKNIPDVSWILSLINKNIISDEETKVHVALHHLFRDGRYPEAYHLLPYVHKVSGPRNIKPSQVGFFKHKDHNKTLLIYSSGGIGDIIMFARFIPEVCRKYSKHKFIFIIKESMQWMFIDAFKGIDNLQLMQFMPLLPHFDYHTNMTTLIAHLKLSLDTISWSHYLKDVKGSDKHRISEPYILFGWKGNEDNKHEIYNRRVPLENLLKALTQNVHLKLVTAQMDITEDERNLLKEYNVDILSDICDREGKTFYDTLTLVRDAKYVISSDTSLLHLAGSVRYNQQVTIGLIVRGHEWRWSKVNCKVWYPNITLIRQSSFGSWNSAMTELGNMVELCNVDDASTGTGIGTSTIVKE